MKAVFLGTRKFEKNGKPIFLVDVAIPLKNGYGLQAVTGFTTEKHYDVFLDYTPLNEYEISLFFKDDNNKANRIYSRKE